MGGTDEVSTNSSACSLLLNVKMKSRLWTIIKEWFTCCTRKNDEDAACMASCECAILMLMVALLI